MVTYRSNGREDLAERRDVHGDRAHYDDVGRSAIRCIRQALDVAGLSIGDTHQILDFLNGHGRGTRLLR
jgi:3-oxoacyl-(acyl-carrier-protein) synthase